ncbi:MAG: hypothetical protein CO133_01945, partial [Candidatus Komeilibacteria bacterium CG_4_9_14_3_um_filter_37_5]
VKLLSWNIQGRYYRGTYTPFIKIAPYLEKYNADVICLQEFSNAEKKLKKFLHLSEYHVYVPEKNNYSEIHHNYNHNVILSKYPIIAAREINFSHSINKTPDQATCVDLQINNKVWRIYNCHLAIDRVGINTRLQQLAIIIKDSTKHQGPVIICGDMNTTIPAAGWQRLIVSLWHQEPKQEMYINGQYYTNSEKYIFQQQARIHGFKETFALNKPTWSPIYSKRWEMFKLKLDWVLTKNLKVEKADLGPYLSDHRPLQIQTNT